MIYRFVRSYNVRQAVISGVSSLALMGIGIHQHQWLPGVVGAAALLVAVRWAMRAASQAPAIEISQSGVSVAGMFGVSELAWSDITSVSLQNRRPSNVLGYYFGGTLGIDFQTDNGFVSRTQLWLPTAAIELPPGGASELLNILNGFLVQSRKGLVNLDRSSLTAGPSVI